MRKDWQDRQTDQHDEANSALFLQILRTRRTILIPLIEFLLDLIKGDKKYSLSTDCDEVWNKKTRAHARTHTHTQTKQNTLFCT